MMEKFWGTLTVLFDYVSAIAPHGVIGGIVLVSGFLSSPSELIASAPKSTD